MLTVDGVGEWATVAAGWGRGSALRLERELHFPHSLGLLSSMVADYLGFDADPWASPALQGEPRYAPAIFENLVDLKADGSFALNPMYFRVRGDHAVFNERIAALLGGPRRRPPEEVTRRHADVAASIQAVIEEVLLALTRQVASEYPSKNLCLAGDIALNRGASARIARDGPFQNIWVQPASGGAGGALGAAFAGHHLFLGQPRARPSTGRAAGSDGWDPEIGPRGSGEPDLICPNQGRRLSANGNTLVAGQSRYPISEGIPLLFVPDGTETDVVTRRIMEFYERAPFPNYDERDTLGAFTLSMRERGLADLLADEIGPSSTVLEVGCGTGQLTCFLAATRGAQVYGTDLSVPSLKLARAFAKANGITGANFIQMNLFKPCFREGTFDLVIAIGVLHHTSNARAAFSSIAKLVKPGGHVVVGLYDRIGRLPADIRRVLWRALGDRTLVLDPRLRRIRSPDKRRAWIADQYSNPFESRHSLSEALEWLNQEGFGFISSLPRVFGSPGERDRLFEPAPPGSRLDRLMAELCMPFSYGREGGMFVMVGKREGAGEPSR